MEHIDMLTIVVFAFAFKSIFDGWRIGRLEKQLWILRFPNNEDKQ